MRSPKRGDKLVVMTNVDRLLAEAMQLSEEERSELANRLTVSLEVSERVDAPWREELKRRRARLRSGASQAEPWEAVEAELMSR
jgi:putative addiction module component (TIGR02574 family)